MKCLIVEDDPTSSLILGRMISRYGSFDAVGNGLEAIQRFKLAHAIVPMT